MIKIELRQKVTIDQALVDQAFLASQGPAVTQMVPVEDHLKVRVAMFGQPEGTTESEHYYFVWERFRQQMCVHLSLPGSTKLRDIMPLYNALREQLADKSRQNGGEGMVTWDPLIGNWRIW